MIDSKYYDVFDSVAEVKSTHPRILQLTDMQIIDSSQERYEGRLNPREMEKWVPENVETNCLNDIRELIKCTNPDLIVITGDIVYGEFDDSGRIQRMFLSFMDSFGIPWAPIFGNHDNESAVGVDAQCDFLESLPNCLFKRGNVTGFGNYTVGVFCGGQPVYALYMLDSHGCGGAFEDKVRIGPHLAEDQLTLAFGTAKAAAEKFGEKIPGLIAYHIPDTTFIHALNSKNYFTGGFGEIGIIAPALDGDCGKFLENISSIRTPDRYCERLTEAGINAILTGHYHKVNTVIRYNGILTVFGTKTGTYDYHSDEQLGGTLVIAGQHVTAEPIYLHT